MGLQPVTCFAAQIRHCSIPPATELKSQVRHTPTPVYMQIWYQLACRLLPCMSSSGTGHDWRSLAKTPGMNNFKSSCSMGNKERESRNLYLSASIERLQAVGLCIICAQHIADKAVIYTFQIKRLCDCPCQKHTGRLKLLSLYTLRLLRPMHC